VSGLAVDAAMACGAALSEIERAAACPRLVSPLRRGRPPSSGRDDGVAHALVALAHVGRRGGSGRRRSSGDDGVVVDERADAEMLTGFSEIKLKAPIIPKKFYHTAGNFREHHEEASKAGFLPLQ